MKLITIGSSSAGNCYLLHGERETLIIEAGVKQTRIFGKMKNNLYLCGDSPKVNTELVGCGNFVFVHKGCRNGLPIPDGFCTVRSEIDFGELGDSAALFLYLYYNFSFMPKSMKNCNGTQGVPIATSAHETRKSLYSKFIIEKNAKNKAYLFILSCGLLSEFADFSRAHNGEFDTPVDRLSLILENC